MLPRVRRAGVIGDVAEHTRSAMHRSAWDNLTKTPGQIWRHPANRGQRLRRVAAWIAWQVWERTIRAPWTVRFGDNLRIRLHPHDFITSGVLYLRLPDWELLPFARRWMATAEGVFVDVGANVGLYSLYVAEAGAKAVGFEPSTVAHGRALDNIARNRLGHAIRMERMALGDLDGMAFLTTRWGGMNHLVDSGVAEKCDGGDVEEVPVMRLDTLDAVEPLGCVALIKIDVEGHESEVLNGAQTVIERDRPALIVEVNDIAALSSYARNTGYTAVHFDPATGALEPTGWPVAPPDNVILVPDAQAAQELLASERSLGPQH